MVAATVQEETHVGIQIPRGPDAQSEEPALERLRVAPGGVRKARSGLREVVQRHRGAEIAEGDALEACRAFVFAAAEERAPGCNGTRGRRGSKHESAQAVKAAKGKLGRTEMLHCRVRHFADGAALGTRKFVEAVFKQERHRFGARRKTGARAVGGLDGMCSLRELRKDTVTPPPASTKPPK
jgi:hypothetical protein